MKRFFDPSPSILRPAHLVLTFTKKKPEELALPGRAVIVFDGGDLKRLLSKRKHRLLDAWTNFRWIYVFDGCDTVVTRSYFGGPNIASLVEELSAFGVKEFIICGYCGGIGETVRLGDIIAARGALREDGVSYHYTEDTAGLIYTDWFGAWESEAENRGFLNGVVWSCDAMYREAEDKIEKYRKTGIAAVEMEVASFYAVCLYKKVKGIAFLTVSDLLKDGTWIPGFHTKSLRDGARKMAEFIMERVVA